MAKGCLQRFFATLLFCACVHYGCVQGRTLQQDVQYGEPYERKITTLPEGGKDYPEKRTRIVTKTFDFRDKDRDGADSYVVWSESNIPNIYEHPNVAAHPWTWKVIANATSIKRKVTPGEDEEGNTYNDESANDPTAIAVALANSKLAPAVAYATAYSMSDDRNDKADATAVAAARARPGLQYGAVVANSDATAIGENTAGAEATAISQAKTGQGVTVAGSRAEAEGRLSKEVSANARSNADSRLWYMAPGHAISGAPSINRGGLSKSEARADANADLGTATGGSIIYANNNGYRDIKDPLGDGVTVDSTTDNDVLVDLGNAAAGSINVGVTSGGKVRLTNSGTTARSAVGNAIAGSLSVGISESGGVSLGDYSDNDNNVPSYERADICGGESSGYTYAGTGGRGSAEAGQLNVAFSAASKTRICTEAIAIADQAPAISSVFSLANSFDTATVDTKAEAETSDYAAVAGNVGLAQSQERANAIVESNAKVRKALDGTGAALAYSISSAVLGEQDFSKAIATAETVYGPATTFAAGQALGGVSTGTVSAASSTTVKGNALALSSAISGSAFTTAAASDASAATNEGAALAGSLVFNFAADAEALGTAKAEVNQGDKEKKDSLVEGTFGNGNAAAAIGGFSVGVIQGKAKMSAKAASVNGTVGALSVAASTGIAQAQSKSTATATTSDGNAQALAGAVSLAGVNSVALATADAVAAEEGDASATALAAGVGIFHGEARSESKSNTKCKDCMSDSVSQAVAVGLIADAEAWATSDADNDIANPGFTLANAMAFGVVSRTSNGANARVTVGPGQALVGGFAVAAPAKVQEQMKATLAKGLGQGNGSGSGSPPTTTTGSSNSRSPPPSTSVPAPSENVMERNGFIPQLSGSNQVRPLSRDPVTLSAPSPPSPSPSSGLLGYPRDYRTASTVEAKVPTAANPQLRMPSPSPTPSSSKSSSSSSSKLGAVPLPTKSKLPPAATPSPSPKPSGLGSILESLSSARAAGNVAVQDSQKGPALGKLILG